MRAPERLTIGPACRDCGASYVQLPRSGLFPPNPSKTLISSISNCHRPQRRIRRKSNRSGMPAVLRCERLTGRCQAAMRRPMQSARKLVIFDCDGTLVDSQHMICAAMQQAFLDHRIDCPPRERLLSIVGLSLAEGFRAAGRGARRAFRSRRWSSATRPPSLRCARRRPTWNRLFPGVREAIEALAARDGHAARRSPPENRSAACAWCSAITACSSISSTIKTADDAPSKPHPGMVLEAMREAGALPGDTVVIGDTTLRHRNGARRGRRAPSA